MDPTFQDTIVHLAPYFFVGVATGVVVILFSIWVARHMRR